jgi:hypothetical protein
MWGAVSGMWGAISGMFYFPLFKKEELPMTGNPSVQKTSFLV